MLLARVLGNVVATQKNQRYEGARIMLVQPVNPDGTARGAQMLALEFVEFSLDQLLCQHDRTFARGHVLARDLLQVVHVVERDALDVTAAVLDVARDRDVDQDDRAAAARVHDERSAVEHEFVLAADAIGVDNGEPRFAHACLDLRPSHCLLLRMKWRTVGDEQNARAGPPCLRGGLLEPDVLADDNAEAHAVVAREVRGCLGGREDVKYVMAFENRGVEVGVTINPKVLTKTCVTGARSRSTSATFSSMS